MTETFNQSDTACVAGKCNCVNDNELSTNAGLKAYWYVLRDLSRPNALRPAYKKLSDLGLKVFTPLHTVITERNGRRERREVPFIHDLLFVYSSRECLDPIIDQFETIQYRFLRGAPFGTPMTVSDVDMHRFITVVSMLKAPRYYSVDELTPEHYGARVRMVCEGPLNGYEGRLLRIKGSGKKRLIVELPGLMSVAIEVSAADYLQLL